MLVIFVGKPGHRTFTCAGHSPSFLSCLILKTDTHQTLSNRVGNWWSYCLYFGCLSFWDKLLFWSCWTPNTLTWRQQMSTSRSYFWSDGFHFIWDTLAFSWSTCLQTAPLPLHKSLTYFCLEVRIHTYFADGYSARGRTLGSCEFEKIFQKLHNSQARQSWVNIDRSRKTVHFHNVIQQCTYQMSSIIWKNTRLNHFSFLLLLISSKRCILHSNLHVGWSSS